MSEPTGEGGQDNWSPAARLGAGVAGTALLGYCLKRRDWAGAALGTVGFGLFTRAVTNQAVGDWVGLGPACRAIEVNKTITIQAPVGQVYDFWRDYRNFPHFMTNVRAVEARAGNRSHWTVAGPAGVPIEWTAELTEAVRNERLAWRTVPGSRVRSAGVIQFQAVNGGTRIQIRLCYHPPGGALGHQLAKLLGADPKSEMDADLVRLKTLLETGHAPRDAAQPWSETREVALARTRAA